MSDNSPIFTETIQMYNLNNNEHEHDNNQNIFNFELEIEYKNIPILSKPFLNFYDNVSKIFYLYTPFISQDDNLLYKDLLFNKFSKIGLSIYQEFPAIIKNKYEDDYHKLNPIDYQENTLLWIHPFKDPTKYDLINTQKNYFFNYSNLLIKYPVQIVNKTIDILIICDNYFDIQSKRWLKYYHNVTLINYMLELLVQSNLNITIIDPMHIVNIYPQFNYIYDETFINITLQKSKICAVFNKHASIIPYIGNALLRDNCLLMYHSILGEWNLINKYTGKFFSDTNSFIQNIQSILANFKNFKPKKWYIKKHNPEYKKQLLYKTIFNLIKK